MEESFTETGFEELELKPELLRAVSNMGFKNLTPVQAEAIPLMLNGTDVIGQAQTGTGKTAAFGLPILQRTDPDIKDVQALILCPTRELAVQVAGELRSYAACLQGVKTLPVYGGQDINRQITGLKGTQIVVGTPGRVMDHMRRHTLKLDSVHTVVLDEADEMLDMGFREDMEEILGAIDHPHQTSMFSATMPQAILDLTEQFLKEPSIVRITQEELTVASIEQFYYAVKREYKVQALLRLIIYYNYKKCMIFCNTKSAVDALVSELQKNGCMAEALHGDLSQFLRDAAMKRFRENESCVLVATDIAARGIDVGDVEAVFNFDIPQEAEYYVHRIGRTGRAGKTGVSHTLAGSREFHKIRLIESVCHSQMTERTIPTPEEIRESRQLKALDQAYELLGAGTADDCVLRVHDFCNEHAITPEELAAAFLALKTGAKTEVLDIGLPAGKEKKRFSGRKERGENQGTFEGKREFRGEPHGKHAPETGFEHFTRKDKDKRLYDPKDQERELRRFRSRLRQEHGKWGNYDIIAEEYREEERRSQQKYRQSHWEQHISQKEQHLSQQEQRRHAPRLKDKSYPDKSDKIENRRRSGKILEQSVKDVNARGWAAPKKKKQSGDGFRHKH